MTKLPVTALLTRTHYLCVGTCTPSALLPARRFVQLHSKTVDRSVKKHAVVAVKKNRRSRSKKVVKHEQSCESVFAFNKLPPPLRERRSRNQENRRKDSSTEAAVNKKIHGSLRSPSPQTQFVSTPTQSKQQTLAPVSQNSFREAGVADLSISESPTLKRTAEVSAEETNATFQPPLADPVSQLTAEQASVLRLALAGASLYIGGNAGTGKSHLLRVISAALRKKGLCVLVTASTGVSALNIDGNTFHSTFRVPVLAPVGASAQKAEELDETTGSLSDRDDQRQSMLRYDAEALAQADAIILDEISLLHAGYLECLDEAARAAEGKDKEKFFGGIQIILSGDFLQLTPFDGVPATRSSGKSERFVCKRVEPEEVEGAAVCEGQLTTSSVVTPSLPAAVPAGATGRRLPVRSYFTLPMYSSYCFNHALLHVQLTQSARHQTDPRFLKELNALRVGKLPFRLSRSALLNPQDPSAIRLFAVKHAVKTFNDQKMLALSGRSRCFPTEVSLHALTKGGEDGSDVISHWSDITQLHFFFAEGKYHFNSHDAQALVKRIIASANDKSAARTLSGRFYVYVCGLSSIVQGSTARVAVRFRGDTQKRAQLYHKQFEAVVSAYIQSHLGGAAARPTAILPTRAKQRAARKTTSAHQAEATLVKQEPMTMRQLLAAVLPTCQSERPHTSDLLLQSKYLKVGCRVMLLRNLNQKYVNGSLGTIEDFLPLEKCGPLLPANMRCPLSWECSALYTRVQRSRGEMVGADDALLSEAELQVGASLPVGKDVRLPVVVMDRDGERVAIPSISLPLPTSAHDGFFTRRLNCMPLTPAYAFTVHKIQGLTLQHPVLFDARNFFPCDHLVYVAASRVKEFSQLRIVNLNPRMISVHQPSLHFSQSLPTATQAEERWTTWMAHQHKNSSEPQSYYLPNWVSRK